MNNCCNYIAFRPDSNFALSNFLIFSLHVIIPSSANKDIPLQIMILQAILTISNFSYDNSLRCAEGFFFDESSRRCVVSQFSDVVDYSLRFGGYRMKKCALPIPESSLLIESTDYYTDEEGNICEFCGSKGPSLNFTECVNISVFDSHCDEYELTGVCGECKSGYALVSSSCKRINSTNYNIENCHVFTDASKCLHCNLGHKLVENKCEKIAHCDSEFYGNNTCLKCEDHYLFDTVTEQCIFACPDGSTLLCGTCKERLPNCVTYGECVSGTPECTTCADGYFVLNGECVECNKTLCVSCTGSADNCIKCAPDRYNVSGVCAICNEHCQECQDTDECERFHCKEGYSTKKNKSDADPYKCENEEADEFCAAFDDHCVACEFHNDVNGINKFYCLACKANYTLSLEDGTCVECAEAFCLRCSDGKCVECIDNFLVDDKGICVLKYPNDNSEVCLLQDEHKMCSECHSSFVRLASGICVRKTSCSNITYNGYVAICNDVIDDEKLQNSHLTVNFFKPASCLTFDKDTTEISGTLACKSCTPGKHIVDFSCVSCPEHCVLCEDEIKGRTICTECTAPYTLSPSGECLNASDLMEGCLDLENINGKLNCKEVASGYFLDKGQSVLCSDATPDCKECESGGKCTTCAQDHVLFEEECKECEFLGKCETCDSSGCLDDLTGTGLYEVSPLQQNAIQQCGGDFCANCDGSQCTECKSGLALLEGQCVSCRSLYGMQCDKCTNQTCEECAENTYFDAAARLCKNCQVAFGVECVKCSASSCTGCIQGMYFNGKICVRGGIMYCLKYTYAERPRCLRCEDGYVPKNGACQRAAIDDCMEFDAGGRCVACVELNYYHNGSACLPCDAAHCS